MNSESSPPTEDKVPILRRIGSSIKRGIKPTVKVLLAVVIVTLIIHSLLLVVWGRQLEHKLNDLRAQGQAVDVADIAPKPVPDSENAAVVYQQAFKLLQSGHIDNGIRRRNVGHNDVPDEFFNDPATGERVKIMPNVRTMIGQASPVFNLTEQAVKRPRCIFPIDWDDGAYATMPHLGLLRQIERLIAARAIIKAETGDMDAAVSDILLGLDATDSLKDEPALISMLVRQANVKMTLTGLMESTRTHPLSYAQAQLLYERLSAIDFKSHMAKAMQGERVFSNWIYDDVRSNLLEVSWLSGQPRPPDKPGLPLKTAAVVGGYLWRPLSYKDQMIFLDIFNKQAALFTQPYRKLKNQHLSDPGENAPKYAIIARMYAASLENLVRIHDDSYAKVGLAQTAMALQAYRSRFGDYPKSLDELNRKLGWKLPDDPFSAKPFIYEPIGSGFKLYSVGWNLKDDDGLTHAKMLGNNSDKGDIVWVCEK